MQNIKEYAANKKEQLKEQVSKMKPMKAVVVQLGHNPASDKYVKNKISDLEYVGIKTQLMNYPEDTSEEALLFVLQALNQDKSITGYIVQMPLPKHISEERIKLAVDPTKDIDGFHPLAETVAATPLGIFNYLKDNNFEFEGKNAVVIGRSNIVGRPMAKLLLDASMNVSVIHSKTIEQDKKNLLRHADLIVVATGYPHTLIKSYIYKPEAVIMDVGINFDEAGKMIGDVDYAEVSNKVAFVSPVPGGCGLLTRLSVIDNVIKLAENK